MTGAAAASPGSTPAAGAGGKVAPAPKVGIMSTIQINLQGNTVDIEKQVIEATNTKYLGK